MVAITAGLASVGYISTREISTAIYLAHNLRKPILIDNTAEIEELKNQSSIERYRIASVLCAPMVVNDEVIGAS